MRGRFARLDAATPSEGASPAPPARESHSLLTESAALLDDGKLEQAETLLRDLLAHEPRNPDGLHLLGLALAGFGRTEEAAERVANALRLRPDAASYHNSFGMLLLSAGDPSAALDSFREAIALEPKFTTAQSNAANALRLLGRNAEAVAGYWQALKLEPENAELHSNLGAALIKLDRLDEAITHFERAVSLNSEMSPAWINLGLAYERFGRPVEAFACFHRAAGAAPHDATVSEPMQRIVRALSDADPSTVRFSEWAGAAPDDPEPYLELATRLRRENCLEHSIQIYEAVIKRYPNHAEAHSDLGITQVMAGDLQEAAANFGQAIALEPDSAEAHNNLAILLQQFGRYDEALDIYAMASTIRPDFVQAQYNRAQLLLLLGRYKTGWDAYDWRLRMPRSNLPSAFLDGMTPVSLAGRTVKVVGEQGPGDIVMFAQCLNDLAAEAREISLHVEGRLAPLFTRSFPDLTVTNTRPEATSGEAGADRAVIIPIGSLPRYYRPDEESFRRGRPRYLATDPEAVTRWRARYEALGSGLKVGISWRGGKTPTERRLRQTSLADWRPLLGVPGVHFVNLQYGDCRAEIDKARERWGIKIADWPDADPLTDLDDFAAQIDALDLVISIANTTVHFPGALGKPIWALVPAAPSWRWQIQRSDSPWYPTMHLIRQKQDEAWCETVRRTADEFALMLATVNQHISK
ncbi:MAG: tetratricopeptide repeat protein [Proteobacteria bacterium]|nr:tetratricopeptide repeat protein [Pseudomonadota bacterium]